MAENQTSLFNPKDYPDKQQAQKHAKWLASLTSSDKAYLKLKKHHLANTHNIYPGKRCQEALSFYLTNGNLFGDKIEKFYHWIQKINPNKYYHCIPNNSNPFKTQLYEYNGMLMDMIYNSLIKSKKK